jgi:gamma-glutamyltranspeptidase/glutathione hydrolase
MPLNASHIYPAVDPVYQAFPSRRSVVHSTKGIVSSTQPLASAAGVKILQQGGNAAVCLNCYHSIFPKLLSYGKLAENLKDAAVAVAAALNLTEPNSTGIGGDMFCLFYDAKTKKVHAMNGSGRSGSKTSLSQIREELNLGDGGMIPTTSVHAVTVPGAAAGWVDTIEKFGSRKLSLEEILKPAIELGEEGYPVSELCGIYVSLKRRDLSRGD